MANTFELIASATVGAGGQADITFTAIPSTFTDLVIKLSARNSDAGADQVWISLNGSTTGFGNKLLYGNGSGSGQSTTINRYVANITTSGYTSNTFSNADIYIPNYAGSANKSISGDTVNENNASTAYAVLAATSWSNTAAITSISLTPQSAGSFVQYSTAYLYGVKNA